ncbi:MAG: twin-arginine translocase TatA/TatE family subunit [Caldilinea sp.]|jgi:sec-independent protein translocase protein TatA
MLPFNFGPVELILILVIVAMLFGVGKLPEVFGAVGKGIREFRKESGIEGQKKNQVETKSGEQSAISNDSSAPQA